MTILAKNMFIRLKRLVQPNPVRDWHVVLSIFTVIFVGIVVWGTWTFQMMISEDSSSLSPNQDKQTLDTVTIEMMRKVFEQRATEENKYIDGTYRYLDPSQ